MSGGPPIQVPAVQRMPPAGVEFERDVPAARSRGGYRDPTARHGRGTLTIRRRWFERPSAWIVLFGTCATMLALIAGLTTFSPGRQDRVVGYVILGCYFPLVYAALAHVVNRSTIHVNEAGVRVAHGPLPWSPSRTIAARSIRRIYVDKVAYKVNGRVIERYRIVYDTEPSEVCVLLSNLPRPHADNIVCLIREHLEEDEA